MERLKSAMCFFMVARSFHSHSCLHKIHTPDLPGSTVIKNPPASAGDARDMGSIPGSERSPGEGEGSPRQYSCLENPMDRGALAGYSLWSRKESDPTEVTERQHNSRTVKCTLMTLDLSLWGHSSACQDRKSVV